MRPQIWDLLFGGDPDRPFLWRTPEQQQSTARWQRRPLGTDRRAAARHAARTTGR